MFFRSTLVFPLALAVALPLFAQMHHVDKPQRITRAVGVYEWTGDIAKPDASRLIPISIFINGQFSDAGVYLAQPIPLALDTGNVYILQRSGDPIGSVDLDYARNIVDRRDVADDNPLGAWYGYGRFHPPAAAPPASALQASSHLSVIASTGDDDTQPHFINRTPATVPGAGPSSSGSSKSGSTTTASTPAPPADPDRPILHRAPNSSSPDTTASTGSAPTSPGTGSIPDDDPDRPTLGHRDENQIDQQNDKHHRKSGDTGAVIPLSTSLNDDPNRPTLRPGKAKSEQAPPALTGRPANLHQAVAVSDAANRPTHIFSREWDSSTERAETLAALQKLAQPLAQQYMTTNDLHAALPSTGPTSGPTLITAPHKTSTSSKSSHSRHHSTKHATSAPLTFHDEQLSGFTLSYGGLPTFVYTASVPTTHEGQNVHLALVVQRLPTGDLQTSLTSVTDDAHLDRTPWMCLVDAVDADASHRASLLFELRERSSRQFALYSLAYAQARQTFVTRILE